MTAALRTLGRWIKRAIQFLMLLALASTFMFVAIVKTIGVF